MPKLRQQKKDNSRALHLLNRARQALGLASLTAIPKGDNPKGKDTPYLCPISRALNSYEVGFDYVQIAEQKKAQQLASCWNTTFNPHPKAGFEVGLPQPIIHFLKKYDRGDYPKLVLEV